MKVRHFKYILICMCLIMWVLWLCKDAYTAALCKEAPVSDSLILQSVLEPEGFSHAELGDKEPQQHSKRGNKSQSDTHTLITSPKLHSTAKKHLPGANHHTPAYSHTPPKQWGKTHKSHLCQTTTQTLSISKRTQWWTFTFRERCQRQGGQRHSGCIWWDSPLSSSV